MREKNKAEIKKEIKKKLFDKTSNFWFDNFIVSPILFFCFFPIKKVTFESGHVFWVTFESGHFP